MYTFRNKTSFYGEELLAPCPTHKLVDNPFLSVCNCLFNIFTATFHTGDRSSMCNLQLHHAMVTGAHLSRCWWLLCNKITFTHPSAFVGLFKKIYTSD